MRRDMPEVIIERPRYGSTKNASYGMRKGRRKAQNNIDAMNLEELENLPIKDNSQRRRKYRDKCKELNENLAPLFRFMVSKVGLLWDDVYSEIRENLNPNSPIQMHILDHLNWYFEKVEKIDGELWTLPPYARKVKDLNDGSFYVDPDSGILMQAGTRRKNHWEPPKAKYMVIDSATQLHKLNGVWYSLHFRMIQKNEELANYGYRLHVDHIYGFITVREAMMYYGDKVLCYDKKQLNKKQLKKYKVKEFEEDLRKNGIVI